MAKCIMVIPTYDSLGYLESRFFMLSRLNQGILFFFVALLVFVWPIPHTNSIRLSLLYLLLLAFGYLTYRKGLNLDILRSLKAPLILCGVFTVWIFIVAFFFSEDLSLTLSEISGTWIRGALFALSLGMMVALVADRSGLLSPRNITVVLFVLLMVSVIYLDIYAIKFYFTEGRLPDRIGIFALHEAGPDKMSILSLIAFSFLLSEILLRIIYKRSMLPFGKIVIAFLVLMVLFSIYIEYMRNGFVVAMALMLSALFIYLFTSKFELKRVLFTLAVLSVIAVAALIHVKEDTDWQSFKEVLPIALDTEGNRKWLDFYGEPPVLFKDGREVGYSNYLRIAWFKEGLILVKENPFGVGYARGAFGTGLMAKYDKGTPGATTHSGLLDLTIGTGVIGSLTWLLFLLSVAVIAFRRSRREANYYALLLLLIVIDFSIRMVLDSIMRDHMLQQFMFMLGFLSVLTVADQDIEEGECSP